MSHLLKLGRLCRCPQPEAVFRRSRPGSPVLTTSSLSVASGVLTPRPTNIAATNNLDSHSNCPRNSPCPCDMQHTSSNTTHSKTPNKSPSRVHSNPCQPKVEALTQTHTIFNSLDEQKLFCCSTGGSVSDGPLRNRSRKSKARDENGSPTKKKNLIGVTLRKLKNSSVSPCRSLPSASDHLASSGDVCSHQLPPLAAPADRCSCSQATLTPSLSRSTAFRDSKRNIRSNTPLNNQSRIPTSESNEALCATTDTNQGGILSSRLAHNPFIVSNRTSPCINTNGKLSCNNRVIPNSRGVLLTQPTSSLQSSPGTTAPVAVHQSGNCRSCKKVSSSKSKIKGSPIKNKHVPRASTLSPPHSLQSSPRQTLFKTGLQKDFNSMQQLSDLKKCKENPIRLKAREARHNRKERVRRNKNAQLLHSKNLRGLSLDSSGQQNDCSQSLASKREQFFGCDMNGGMLSGSRVENCADEQGSSSSSSVSSCSNSTRSSSNSVTAAVDPSECSRTEPPECCQPGSPECSKPDPPVNKHHEKVLNLHSTSYHELSLVQRRKCKVSLARQSMTTLHNRGVKPKVAWTFPLLPKAYLDISRIC